VLAHRRSLAVGCVGVAVVAGLRVLAPAPPPTVPVVVAARDLPGGVALSPSDLTLVDFPAALVPAGMTSLGLAADPGGRVLAAPLRAGEPVTDVRLVGAPLAGADPGVVATPVRLPDAAAAALLRAGDRIDLLATDPRRGRTTQVADGAVVLAVPPQDEGGAGPLGGRIVLLALPSGTVEIVAGAAVDRFLSYAYSD
jgi:Flp pilus assembly protein CpaB